MIRDQRLNRKSMNKVGATTGIRTDSKKETFEMEQGYVFLLEDGMVHIEGHQGYGISGRITMTRTQAAQMISIMALALVESP